MSVEMDAETDNSEKVPMTEVRKCLREAGSYDPTMSENEMLELYEVLNHSKHTASKEDEQRRILEETERNCSMIEELRRNSVPVYREADNKDSCKNDSDASVVSVSQSEEEVSTQQTQRRKPLALRQDDNEVVTSTTVNAESELHDQSIDSTESNHIDVFNSKPTTHEPLKRIIIKPKYNPPLYCNPKLANMNHELKSQLIAEYHIKLLHKFNVFQRQLIIPAPWGKPVQPNARFNGSLMRKIEKVPEEENADAKDIAQSVNDDKNSDDDFEIYVSQSGRQTKRKLYCEIPDNNNEPKKNKTTDNTSHSNTKKPQGKKRVAPLKNEEIMKRSKLFAEGTPTRTEKLFDKLAEDEEKKKAAEREVEKFAETLKQLSDEENMDTSTRDIAELVHSEEPFVRRRIVPPSLPAKNSSKATAAGSKSSRGGGRPTWKGKTATKKSQENISQKKDADKYSPLNVSITRDANKEETGICPLCNVEFPQSELTQHASGCQDSYSEKQSYSYKEKIACENCDQVLPLSMDYEEHVRECLAKARRSSSSRV